MGPLGVGHDAAALKWCCAHPRQLDFLLEASACDLNSQKPRLLRKCGQGWVLLGMGKIKVLYLHALEAGPGSLKHKYLDSCFDTQCPKLGSGSWMLRLRVLAGVMIALLITLWTVIWVLWWFILWMWFHVWVPIVTTVVVALVLVAVFWLSKRCFLRFMLQEAVGTADEAFVQFKPDIVVGQSFGCVVALHMQTAKRSPLLLLAPANHYFHSHAGIYEKPDLSPYPFVTVVHGEEDSFIPVADSELLVGTSEISSELKTLKNEDHRLMSLGEFELRKFVHTTVFKVDPELAGVSMWTVPPPNWPAASSARDFAKERCQGDAWGDSEGRACRSGKGPWNSARA